MNELLYINSQKRAIDYEESKIDENVDLRVRMLFSRDGNHSPVRECAYREAVRRIYEKSVSKKRRALKKLEKDLEELYRRYDKNLL